ncbi:methyltransferase domain-containing protein [Sphingorhabdus sp. Alg239-R122]|uniref:methyltransferase domain-containing protein n=1 Tax=Sphingorhabdus sp. Alg239-R122 TaxID=2305989 RepID=UPI0013DC7727|nr:methyltransferase domain-containing protein [Sphingorhabdus sp. Alg239-R122]
MNIENSRDYYGSVLQGSDDLKTDACVTTEAPPQAVRDALKNVHEEVKSRYYGCGLIAPQAIEGARVLDLGSGSGQDAYILAQLVGEKGSVVGVDTTPEQLEVADRHLEWHRETFGYAKSNVSFVEGDIEKLDELGLEPGSFDIIVSNCVINLVADKGKVFRDAHRLLGQGGEMYFSDVYCDRRVPAHLLNDPVLHGECLSGALYWGDFDRLAKEAGFADPRVVKDRPMGIGDTRIQEMLDGINFFSATYRLFKLDELETECEDYGQAVIYKGGIEGQERVFELDKGHMIEKGRVFPICGNSWKMLADTRFAEYFEFVGDFAVHYGVFAGCGGGMPYDVEGKGSELEAAFCC